MGATARDAPLIGESFVEGWRDFYSMAGTAAVTLAGLLFVALSLHVETLAHDQRERLLALSRATLLSFVFVLTTRVNRSLSSESTTPRHPAPRAPAV